MANLVIIGNGFDLSHNLKTSYKDFISYIIDTHIKDRSKFSDLLNISNPTVGSYKYLENYVKSSNGEFPTHFKFQNDFFENLIKDATLKDWYDIEEKYYQLLKNCKNSYAAKILNDQFEIVKNYLEDYLVNEIKMPNPIEGYVSLFKSIDYSDTLILNFNYTNTLKLYFSDRSNSKIINIHGELGNRNNPIIFGYAADEQVTIGFLDQGDDFILNIKNRLYPITNNYAELKDFLKRLNINVFIIGHSCGLSDKQILKDIFINTNIYLIRIYYHKDAEHYLKIKNNVDRITRIINNSKIMSFPNSLLIPQLDDDKDIVKEFIEKDRIFQNSINFRIGADSNFL